MMGAFHYTGPTGQKPLGPTKAKIERVGAKTATELIVGYCLKG